MCRQRPAVRRGEHPILEHVGVGVRPVVRDLLPGHEAHDVGLMRGSDVRSARRRSSVGAEPRLSAGAPG